MPQRTLVPVLVLIHVLCLRQQFRPRSTSPPLSDLPAITNSSYRRVQDFRKPFTVMRCSFHFCLPRADVLRRNTQVVLWQGRPLTTDVVAHLGQGSTGGTAMAATTATGTDTFKGFFRYPAETQ